MVIAEGIVAGALGGEGVGGREGRLERDGRQLDVLGLRKLGVDVDLLALLVAPLHPEQQRDTRDENGAAGSQVEPVADAEVRCVGGEETPCRDQAADVAKHDDCADGGGARRVGDDVGRALRVAERAEGEGAGRDDEGRSVAHLRHRAGQEHNVADHHEGRAHDDEDHAAVEAPAEEGEEEREESAHDVRRDSAELLVHDGGAWVDGSYDGRREEGKTLHGDVVQEEDERCGQDDGVEDTAERLLPVELVENLVLSNALRLDTRDSQILLLLSQPPRSLGSIGQGDEGDEGEEAGDDALDGEDHPPAGERAKRVECEDSRGQETTERAGQRRHDNVQRETERQLRASVPSRHVVCNTRQHSRLENAQHESHAADVVDVLDERGSNGGDTEAERDEGDEPSRTHPLAADITGNLANVSPVEHECCVSWVSQTTVTNCQKPEPPPQQFNGCTDLEDDVADVEDGEDLVVVVALQPQVLLQAGQTRITNVGAIDETEKIQQRDCGDNVEIDLQPQPGLGLGVECEQRVAIAGDVSAAQLQSRQRASYISVAV
ncbi:hypothetical protein OPT61_g9364 [Boeremia exigua]|uniref:Uncharacterized protein n=1 Tax=Boeremia exigua TaxID=749465 RepID=A0ACC2HUU4_9PLEO|nr:hypothetical protein OPT61_g9364 [Boeremia exigua]